jgi:hypothetical protein
MLPQDPSAVVNEVAVQAHQEDGTMLAYPATIWRAAQRLTGLRRGWTSARRWQ